MQSLYDHLAAAVQGKIDAPTVSRAVDQYRGEMSPEIKGLVEAYQALSSEIDEAKKILFLAHIEQTIKEILAVFGEKYPKLQAQLMAKESTVKQGLNMLCRSLLIEEEEKQGLLQSIRICKTKADLRAFLLQKINILGRELSQKSGENTPSKELFELYIDLSSVYGNPYNSHSSFEDMRAQVVELIEAAAAKRQSAEWKICFSFLAGDIKKPQKLFALISGGVAHPEEAPIYRRKKNALGQDVLGTNFTDGLASSFVGCFSSSLSQMFFTKNLPKQFSGDFSAEIVVQAAQTAQEKRNLSHKD